MARKSVAELKSGDSLDQLFLLRTKALRTTRTGGLYMHLELADRSGMVPGRVWDASPGLFESIDENSFVRVKGRAELYQGKMQVVALAVETRPDSEANIEDFLPSTNKDVGEMFARLVEIAKTVKHAGLRKLLGAFLTDEALASKLRRAPAATEYHHAFLGGLLEHTLWVAEMALLAAKQYPDLDYDLLVTGVILHDIGKVEEFSYERGFRYTDEGELLGHLYIGARMIEERAAGIEELSEGTRRALVHLILSHHGAYEYQSPKLPMTAEALAVHHLDNLDAKLNAFRSAMLRDRDPGSKWTEWNRMFERKLFKGYGVEEEKGKE